MANSCFPNFVLDSKGVCAFRQGVLPGDVLPGGLPGGVCLGGVSVQGWCLPGGWCLPKTGISVVPQKGLMSTKQFFKKRFVICCAEAPSCTFKGRNRMRVAF